MGLVELLIYGLIGVFAGFLAGLFGIGGGLISVPGLALVFYWMNFPSSTIMQLAIGTSLAAMVMTSASSAWSHHQQKGIIWPIYWYLAPGIIVGALVGAFIADYLPSQTLKMIFGACLGLIGIYFISSAKSSDLENELHLPNVYMFTLIGVAIGAISTILGIGGGVMTVPILRAYGNPLKQSISTSAATGFLIALMGAMAFFYFGQNQTRITATFGYIYLPAFITIGITSVISAPYGAMLTYKWSNSRLKILFGSLLISVGFIMLIV